jgi:hypothetical protein
MERLILPYTRIFLFIALVSFAGHTSAQVAISTRSTTPSPDPTAVLLLVGDGSQGLIIPTITNIATSAPGSAGMIAYSAGKVYYSDGNNWTAVGGGTGPQGILINGNIVQIGTGGSFTSQFLLSNTPPTSGVQRGQLLQWDGGTNQWSVTKDIGTALTDGQVLSWNASQNKWEPRTISVGGGGVSTINKGGAGNFISITNPTGPITTINADAIVDGDISGTANISGTKLQDGTLPVSKLSTGTAINGQFLRYNSGAWSPFTLAISSSVTNVTATAPLISSGGTTPNISLSGTLPVANGGTGRTTWDGILWGNGAGSITDIGNGINGQVFTMQGTSPGWSPAPSSFTTTNVLPKGSAGGLVASQIFDNGTNVGIGTTTPGGKLQIDGADWNISPVVINSGGTSAGSTLRFINPAAGNHIYDVIGSTDAGSDPGVGSFGIWDHTSSAYRFVIKPTGNIGLGTTTPVNKLDVAGGMAIGSSYAGINIAPTNGLLIEGSLGIGLTTVTGGTKLEITGGDLRISDSFPFITLNASSTTNNSGFNFIESGTSKAYIYYRGSSDEIWLSNSSGGGSQHLVVATTGNVGIKRTPLANDLEVEGTASKAAAGSWIINSDRRIKTDIRDIDNSLEIIKKIRPVRYKYTDEWLKRNPSIKDHDYYSFIAQEFQQVFPEAVQGSGEYLEGDKKEILQIDPHNAQIVTIKAVQEQQKIIELQQAEITSLKKELSEIKNYLGLEAKTTKKKKGKK